MLIDTGFGRSDYKKTSRKMRFFLRYMGVPQDIRETAYFQVQELGFQPEDVTDIICIHLHIDHAGGLRDFPWAKVHVYSPEHQFTHQPRGWSGFAIDPSHWAHHPDWKLYDAPDQDWFGLKGIRLNISYWVDFMLVPFFRDIPRGTAGLLWEWMGTGYSTVVMPLPLTILQRIYIKIIPNPIDCQSCLNPWWLKSQGCILHS